MVKPMTKKHFEVGDKIGKYVLTEFGGTKDNGEPLWWASTGTEKHEDLVPVSKLLKELRVSELTPALIAGLSSKAYDELCKEVGLDEIDRVISRGGSKPVAPSKENQVEIARAWWELHPQIPRTRSNVQAFDDYLAKMPSPTFSTNDFDRAFSDLFTTLELNPKLAGIDGHGEAVRGWTALEKLSSAQIKQLQKAFPVTREVDYSNLSLNETIKEVGNLPISSDQFIKWTEEVDKELGIKRPVPPLLLEAREKIWANFFQLHPTVVPSEEIKAKLLALLQKNSKFNPSDETLPVLNQHLDQALEFLIQNGGEVEVFLEPNAHASGGSRWIVNEPRPRGSVPQFDDTPVEVSLADINKMSSSEYAQKMLNPNFRDAVDRLMANTAR
jgi:hypothetical protein